MKKNPNPTRAAIRAVIEIIPDSADLADLDPAGLEIDLEAAASACPGLIVIDMAEPVIADRSAGVSTTETLIEVEALDLNAARAALCEHAEITAPDGYGLGAVIFTIQDAPPAAMPISQACAYGRDMIRLGCLGAGDARAVSALIEAAELKTRDAAEIAHALEALEDSMRGAAEAMAKAGARAAWLAADLIVASAGACLEAAIKADTVAEHGSRLISAASAMADKPRPAVAGPAGAAMAIARDAVAAAGNEADQAGARIEIDAIRAALAEADPESDGSEAVPAKDALAASGRAHATARAALEAAAEIRAARLMLMRA